MNKYDKNLINYFYELFGINLNNITQSVPFKSQYFEDPIPKDHVVEPNKKVNNES